MRLKLIALKTVLWDIVGSYIEVCFLWLSKSEIFATSLAEIQSGI